ncbi:MAG: thiamine-phosphate kinase [Symploca sp. SIO2E6]|nr:thiamine-phosphate kinase [Symploca sp. SIO2E6]
MSSGSNSVLVQDIGEQGLLARLQRFCPPDIIGDDAAVIPVPEEGKSLVVTTDILVDGVHFSDRTTSPEDVGWRAAAANLSDLAAMGASPLGITVGLSVNGEVAVSWVEQLYQGLTYCLEQYNTPIVGGDICRSPVRSISITAFGQVASHRTLRRSAAQVGDAIVVTGVHGASRGGLELLLNPKSGLHLRETERRSLILAHQRPQPRLDVVPILGNILSPISLVVHNNKFDGSARHGDMETRGRGERKTCQNRIGGLLAGMDSSDGLADAVVQICRASGVGAVVDRNKIPLPPALNQLVSLEEVWDWVLYGGEDFELVLCLSAELAEVLVEQLGAGAAVIGKITTGNRVWLTDSSDIYADEELSLSRGFQHFGNFRF